MNPENKPFLFVGTAKAGTTSIYSYLRQHPRIFVPKKETFFFLRDIYENISLDYPMQRSPETMILDEAEYKELYREAGKRTIGEVGTGYLFHHEVAIPRIREEYGVEVNILIVLRDPVQRALSSYNHFVKDMHESLSFHEALSEEASRAQQGWDFMWRHRELGLYADQVQAYMDVFPKVKVLLYEDLKADPVKFMKEVFLFLGVENFENLDTTKQLNPSGQPRSKTIQKLLIHDNPLKNMIRPVVRGLMSDERRERIRKELKSKNLKAYEEMPSEIRKELKNFYRSDIEKLQKVTGIDLSAWID